MYECSTGSIFWNMTKITTQSYDGMFGYVLDFFDTLYNILLFKCSSQIGMIKCFQIVTWGFNFVADVKQRHGIQHNYEVAGDLFWISVVCVDFFFSFYMFHTCIFQTAATLKSIKLFLQHSDVRTVYSHILNICNKGLVLILRINLMHTYVFLIFHIQ